MPSQNSATSTFADQAIPADGRRAAFATRRRSLKGGVGFAPVLMESVPRSLITDDIDDGGMPPFARPDSYARITWNRCEGYGPESWVDPWLAFEWPVEFARTGLDAARFDEVFGHAHGYPDKTFLDVLQLPAGNGKDDVARHAVAAVLNGSKGLTPSRLLGVDVMRAMWHSFVTLGHCVPTPGVKWFADTSIPRGAGSILQWLRSSMSR